MRINGDKRKRSSIRDHSRYSQATFPAHFFAYFAGKLPALRGHITHTPHIANIGIEHRTDRCKNPRAGGSDLTRPLFEKNITKQPVAQCGESFFSKTPGQPVENGVTHMNATLYMSQNTLGQAWDKLG